MTMLPVVILAGGLGTRLQEVTGDRVPKAMVPVAGRPFIDHQLATLAGAGVGEVVLLIGSLGEQIEAHVGDGRRFGLTVRCVPDGEALLGTGGAVHAALDVLPAAFWVTYGDTLLDVDMAGAEAKFSSRALGGLMTVLENADRWEVSNVDVVHDLVTVYDPSSEPGRHRFIDYGMSILEADAFDGQPPSQAFGLDRIFGRLIAQGRLGAFEVRRRFYDIGSPARLAETEAFVRAQGLAP